MQNSFSCYQKKSVTESDKSISVVVGINERDDGIEFSISRKAGVNVRGSIKTNIEKKLTLTNLSVEQVIKIVELIDNWLSSKSYPLMDMTISEVEGTLEEEEDVHSRNGSVTRTDEFSSVAIEISEYDLKFRYWDEEDQEWKDISLPSAEAIDEGDPKDIKNITKLRKTFYDFFTTEYSSTIDYFENDRSADKDQSAVYRIEKIFNRFGEMVIPLQERQGDKEPLTMDKEVDVQYYLHSLLKLHFDDVRREPHTERHSSVSPRIDFLINNETIGIEVKRASSTRKERDLRTELSEDKEQYRLDTNIDTLLVFVYDPDKQIENKAEFESSFEQDSPQMTTRVTVTR